MAVSARLQALILLRVFFAHALEHRERTDASGFTTGLDEYRKYLLRKKEAEAMKAEHEAQENGEGG